MTEAQQQSLLNVQSNLSTVSINIERNMLNKVEKLEKKIKNRILENIEKKDEIGREKNYQPDILFEITEDGIDFWKQRNIKSYEEAGSPEPGYKTNLFNIREGPFEYPANLLNGRLRIVGFTIDETKEYALRIYNKAKEEQKLAIPVVPLKEEELYAKDFVYNSINEYQGNDPFRLLKELPNKKSGLICDMKEFNDTGGDILSGIVSRVSYKNYEASFDIKFTEIAKYRNNFTTQKVCGIFFGYPYNTVDNKLKGYAGNGSYQIESGYPQNQQTVEFSALLFFPEILTGTQKAYLASNTKELFQEIFDNIENGSVPEPKINYKIIHYENIVKIFINGKQVEYITNPGEARRGEDPVIVNVIDIGVNYGSFGFQCESCGFEVTNLKIKPAEDKFRIRSLKGPKENLTTAFIGLGKAFSDGEKSYSVGMDLRDGGASRVVTLVNLTDNINMGRRKVLPDFYKHNGKNYNISAVKTIIGVYKNDVYIVATLDNADNGYQEYNPQPDTKEGFVILKGPIKDFVYENTNKWLENYETVKVVVKEDELTNEDGFKLEIFEQDNGGLYHSYPGYGGTIVGDTLITYQFFSTIAFLDLKNPSKEESFRFYSSGPTSINTSIQDKNKLIVSVALQTTEVIIYTVEELEEKLKNKKSLESVVVIPKGYYEIFDIEKDKYIAFDHITAESTRQLFKVYDNLGNLIIPQPEYSIVADSISSIYKDPESTAWLPALYQFVGLDPEGGESVSLAAIKNNKFYVVYTKGYQLTYKL